MKRRTFVIGTLANVLEELEGRGVLVRRHGIGIFVARDVHQRHIALLCHPRFFAGSGDASPFWQQFVQQVWQQTRQRGATLAVHFVAAEEHDKPVAADGAPASLGDMLTQSKDFGGLALGASTTSLLFAAVIIVLVAREQILAGRPSTSV